MRTISSILLSMLLSGAAVAADFQYASIIGRWQVVGVALARDSGIQALVVDDPSFMGAIVEFESGRITWKKGTKKRPVDPSIDDCSTAPTLTPADNVDPEQGFRVAGGFTIRCAAEGWGPAPGAVLLPVDSRAIKLYWFDGGVLTLKRLD